MKVDSIKTHKILPKEDIYRILDQYLPNIEENSVLAITSKIISLCEDSVIKIGDVNKDELIIKESDSYLPIRKNLYRATLTIKNNILIPNAGIDESNGNGFYILWPQNPQKTASMIRSYVSCKLGLKNFGVILTDSKTTPLRWGTTGIAIAYSGIKPLHNYIGRKDIFGREMMATKANVYDALAATAVLAMGEGSEQTPMALISNLNFVKFCKNDPAKEELNQLKINISDDIYGEILSSVKWQNN